MANILSSGKKSIDSLWLQEDQKKIIGIFFGELNLHYAQEK
jgi:hypothetical protein